MKTIKNFKEITFELLEKENHFIISEESGNYEIKIWDDSVNVQNHSTNMRYFYELDTDHFVIGFMELVELAENPATVEEFIEGIRKLKYFKEYTHKAKFNPFYKELKGKIELKTKEDRLSKAQLKKLLKHVNSKVVIKYEFSDDYLTDASMNFMEGVELHRNEFLERICEYGKYYIEKNEKNEIEVFDGNNSYIVKNEKLNII